MGAIWRAAIPGAQSVRIAKSGHLADLEAPEALSDLVRNFALEGCDGIATLALSPLAGGQAPNA